MAALGVVLGEEACVRGLGELALALGDGAASNSKIVHFEFAAAVPATNL